jgi:hypothetical protein
MGFLETGQLHMSPESPQKLNSLKVINVSKYMDTESDMVEMSEVVMLLIHARFSARRPSELVCLSLSTLCTYLNLCIFFSGFQPELDEECLSIADKPEKVKRIPI